MDQAGFRDWLCRRLVAESRDAIIFADKDGLIRLWNAAVSYTHLTLPTNREV